MIDAIRITPREIDVLQLACRGLEPKEVADQLSIAEQTVRVHLRSLTTENQVSQPRRVASVGPLDKIG